MTRAEYRLQQQERLALYILAEVQIMKGAQSYSIGNRTLTRADLHDIRQEIKDLQKECLKLSRGGNIRVQRVVVRDN